MTTLAWAMAGLFFVLIVFLALFAAAAVRIAEMADAESEAIMAELGIGGGAFNLDHVEAE